MKKYIVTLGIILCMFLHVQGQEKPVLKFNSDSRFKIVQFTDFHFQNDSYRSDSAMVIAKTVIEREKPDLVVLTGDLVCTKDTRNAWLKFAQTFIDAKVPWAVMFGNHDSEYELTTEEIINTIAGLPYNVTVSGPDDISGNGNYILPIQSSKSNKTEALCYIFDSHSSFKPRTNLGDYEWIDFSQIGWYREQSATFTRQNGGKPLPAVAFFHIPFPEFKEIIGKSTTYGIQNESVCSPDINSGLYTAMLECKDVMGVFVGHEHNNNYIGCLRGICLAYGQVTGRQCYGDIGRGARVIELHEGQRKFDSWILKLYECNRNTDMWAPTYSKERMFYVNYPNSFVEPTVQNDIVLNNRIAMVNHRGANRLAPENTYASAQKAIDLGVTYMEVDVRRSKDGVYYNMHDNTLNRTTNGRGLVSATESSVIDTLDAGGWFAHEFKGERVPRLYDYLKWIKGKAKVYFDMKDYRLDEFIPYIYETGMENDCFFWFSTWEETGIFRERYPDLALKVNANSVEALDSLKKLYNPQIIECPVSALNESFIRSCREKDMKVMPIATGFDMKAFRTVIEKEADMINLDCPEIFSAMLKNNGIFDGYKLIAHRGGIVENKYDEFDPASIQAAIDQGYFMLEIDVRQTKDGVLLLNHDDNFGRYYNDFRKIKDLTWEEIRRLKPVRGNYSPMSLEELAQMCTGKVELMIDIKDENPSPAFLDRLDKILTEYHFFPKVYFITENVRERFWGKAKFSFRVAEEDAIREKIARGEDVACHYFLFDAGTRLTSSIIKSCQAAYITVVPSVNFGHYRYEDTFRGAKRDIEFLKECGVIEHQIDSDFDVWF